MKIIYLLITFLISTFLVPTIATAVTLDDLKLMDPLTASQVLDQLSNKAPENVSRAEQADEWVTLAERLGKALSSLAREAGVALNEFVKTPVGVITITVLLWKTIGVSIVAGLIWALSLSLIIWSFRNFHVPAKNKVIVRNSEGKAITEDGKPKEKIEYIKRYEFSSSDARVGSAFAHVAMFIMINLMLILVIAFS